MTLNPNTSLPGLGTSHAEVRASRCAAIASPTVAECIKSGTQKGESGKDRGREKDAGGVARESRLG